MSKEDIINYIRKNYKTPNIAILKTLGATDELIEYLTNTPWNTNIKIVEGLISQGSEDDKPGIKSITISPALETTPTIASLFPMYWDASKAQDGWQEFDQELKTGASLTDGAKYTVTVTPTSEWCVGYEGQISEVGKPFTYEVPVKGGGIRINLAAGIKDGNEGIETNITIMPA